MTVTNDSAPSYIHRPGPGGGGGGTLTPENFEQAFRASHPEVASHLGATAGGPEGGSKTTTKRQQQGGR